VVLVVLVVQLLSVVVVIQFSLPVTPAERVAALSFSGMMRLLESTKVVAAAAVCPSSLPA
jgi:hypothetical protein